MTPIDLRRAYEEDCDVAPKVWEDASRVAKKAGIHILSDRELTAIAVDERGAVIGALFTAFSPGQMEYTFDVAVDPAHQKKGIGTALTKAGISEFTAYADHEDAKMVLDVVNPTMERVLQGCGFHVTERIRGHAMMEPLPQPTLALPEADFQAIDANAELALGR